MKCEYHHAERIVHRFVARLFSTPVSLTTLPGIPNAKKRVKKELGITAVFNCLGVGGSWEGCSIGELEGVGGRVGGEEGIEEGGRVVGGELGGRDGSGRLPAGDMMLKQTDIQKARRHLRAADPVMKAMIEAVGPFTLRVERDRIIHANPAESTDATTFGTIRGRWGEVRCDTF